MADDLRGEKTEAPSPRRRQEARERGNVARSVDLNSALFLLVAFCLLYAMGRRILAGMGSYQERVLARLGEPPLDRSSVLAVLVEMAYQTGTIVLPFLGVLLAIAVAVNLIQTGFLLTGKPLTPDWSRLNPIKGFGRLFSAQSAMRLVMSVLKILLISVVVYWIIAGEILGMAVLSEADPWTILGGVSRVVFLTAIKLGVLLASLAFLDYLFQRWQHEKDLRMTKQEVRDELRRYEGDPQVRARRMQMARQIARQRMMKAVEKADVVITNPTELAIALEYDPAENPAPRVVAKGARLMALRIRQVASENGIPIVERKPLAQALFKACKPGDVIPEALYKAVAEVLSFIYGMNPEKARRFTETGQGMAR